MIPSVAPDLDLRDEFLTENRAPDCALTVQISNEHLAFAVMDLQDTRYLAAQVYRYPYHFSPDDFSIWLQETTSSGMASWHYSTVRVMAANLDYTLVPGPLFNPLRKEEYLRFNLSSQGDMLTLTDRLAGLDACTVYTLPLWLHVKLMEIFPGAPLHHAISCYLESVLNHYKFRTRHHSSFINLQPGFFDLIILNEQKITFCNSFSYKSTDDVLYYIMFILEQTQLLPDDLELLITGEMGRHAQVVEKLTSYLTHVDFLGRNESFRYSPVFDKIPGHYLYTLLSAAECEL